MARTKMTDEEKELAKKKKDEEKAKIEQEKNLQINYFKECDYINTLDDETILNFINLLKTDYDDMKPEEAIQLLFKKFINKDFMFNKTVVYK